MPQSLVQVSEVSVLFMEILMDYQTFASTIRPFTTYSNNGVTLTTRESEWVDSPFECYPVCPDGRPVALVVTGHRSWEADANVSQLGPKNDRGLKDAKAWFKQAYGKCATFAKPVYLFQHGQVALESRPSCMWDSGFLGFILMRKGDVLSTEYDALADVYLTEWTQYYNNEAWGFTLEIDCEHVDNDSTGGFTGDFESCGLDELLWQEHELAVRLAFDDDTLDLRRVKREFGQAFIRMLSTLDTKVGAVAKKQLEVEERVRVEAAEMRGEQ